MKFVPYVLCFMLLVCVIGFCTGLRVRVKDRGDIVV